MIKRTVYIFLYFSIYVGASILKSSEAVPFLDVRYNGVVKLVCDRITSYNPEKSSNCLCSPEVEYAVLVKLVAFFSCINKDTCVRVRNAYKNMLLGYYKEKREAMQCMPCMRDWFDIILKDCLFAYIKQVSKTRNSVIQSVIDEIQFTEHMIYEKMRYSSGLKCFTGEDGKQLRDPTKEIKECKNIALSSKIPIDFLVNMIACRVASKKEGSKGITDFFLGIIRPCCYKGGEKYQNNRELMLIISQFLAHFLAKVLFFSGKSSVTLLLHHNINDLLWANILNTYGITILPHRALYVEQSILKHVSYVLDDSVVLYKTKKYAHLKEVIATVISILPYFSYSFGNDFEWESNVKEIFIPLLVEAAFCNKNEYKELLFPDNKYTTHLEILKKIIHSIHSGSTIYNTILLRYIKEKLSDFFKNDNWKNDVMKSIIHNHCKRGCLSQGMRYASIFFLDCIINNMRKNMLSCSAYKESRLLFKKKITLYEQVWNLLFTEKIVNDKRKFHKAIYFLIYFLRRQFVIYNGYNDPIEEIEFEVTSHYNVPDKVSAYLEKKFIFYGITFSKNDKLNSYNFKVISKILSFAKHIELFSNDEEKNQGKQKFENDETAEYRLYTSNEKESQNDKAQVPHKAPISTQNSANNETVRKILKTDSKEMLQKNDSNLNFYIYSKSNIEANSRENRLEKSDIGIGSYFISEIFLWVSYEHILFL